MTVNVNAFPDFLHVIELHNIFLQLSKKYNLVVRDYVMWLQTQILISIFDRILLYTGR